MSDVVQFKSKSSTGALAERSGANEGEQSLLREEAAIWLVRLQEGLSPTQATGLNAWLSDHQDNQHHLLELAAMWDDMEVLTELAPIFDKPIAHRDSSSRRWLGERLKAASWAICAVATALFAFQFLPEQVHLEAPVAANKQVLPAKTIEQEQIEYYGTQVGERAEVLLSDGSIVTLNTDSHIEVDFNQQSRKIQLVNGEVHIDVFKDPSRPLSIIADNKAVQAVGTAFSVRKYANESSFEVAVDEGKVAVFKEYSGAELVADKAWRSLQVGEVLRIVENTQSIRVVDSEELADRLAWKAGMIVINDETLDYVVQEFGRHSNKKIVIADAKMRNIRVAGYFKLGDIPALLVALDQNFGISSEYNREEQSYILSQH